MTGILWAVPIALNAPPKLYPNGQAHHCTLQYGAEREQWDCLIGLPVTIGVTVEASNDRIQAIKVVLPNWVPCQNAHPHITVSWIDGASPIESNVMLSEPHRVKTLDLDHVTCVIEWLEWEGKPVKPRQWRDRSKALCPTCLNQGNQTLTRSMSGYCRRHRNG